MKKLVFAAAAASLLIAGPAFASASMRLIDRAQPADASIAAVTVVHGSWPLLTLAWVLLALVFALAVKRVSRASAALASMFILAVVIASVTLAHAQTVSDSGTVVHGGQFLADLIGWGEAAFGTAIAALLTALAYKAMAWMGIQVSSAQRDQLQAIVVNGINAAAAKSEAQLKTNPSLDINVKNQVVTDAIAYVQTHGADTIRALGLDPASGQAVQAIRARIATAIADPKTPTDPAVTPIAAGGVAK